MPCVVSYCRMLCFVFFPFVLFCFVLSCRVLPCLVFPSLVLPCLALSCFVPLSCLAVPCLALYRVALPFSVLCWLVLSGLAFAFCVVALVLSCCLVLFGTVLCCRLSYLILPCRVLTLSPLGRPGIYFQKLLGKLPVCALVLNWWWRSCLAGVLYLSFALGSLVVLSGLFLVVSSLVLVRHTYRSFSLGTIAIFRFKIYLSFSLGTIAIFQFKICWERSEVALPSLGTSALRHLAFAFALPITLSSLSWFVLLCAGAMPCLCLSRAFCGVVVCYVALWCIFVACLCLVLSFVLFCPVLSRVILSSDSLALL